MPLDASRKVGLELSVRLCNLLFEVRLLCRVSLAIDRCTGCSINPKLVLRFVGLKSSQGV